MQYGLYLFTWEMSSVNSTMSRNLKKGFYTVEGMNFASKKIETMLHWGLDFCTFLYIFTYDYIFLGAFLYFFWFVWRKIDSQWAGIAYLIHYPINCIRKNENIHKSMSKKVYMYIYIYIHIYIYEYINVYVHVNTYMYIYTCILV